MSGMPKLDQAPINLAALRESSRLELMAALDGVTAPDSAEGGGKALVLDPALSGPMGLIAEVREFKEHGVEKIYHLLDEPLNITSKRAALVFFVRPSIKQVERVAAQVQQLERGRADGGARRSYHLFFVPRRSMVCERVLQEEGVYGLVTVREFGAQMIPLEDDVLSLEQPCFRELFLDDDRTVLYSVAAGVMKLQAMFGLIPLVRGKGERAQQVLHMVQQMRASLEADGQLPAREAPPEIGSLLLIDRDCDLVTPMLTELTYEGLVHSTFGIAHGYVDLDAELVGGGAGGARVKREMNNNDALYRLTRNLNFGELGPLLHRLARETSAGYDERHSAHTVSQIRDFMKKLSVLQSTHKSLATHVNLAERIQRTTRGAAFHRRLEAEQTALNNGATSAEAEQLLETLVGEQAPLPSVLRLACLLSLVSNGLRPKALQSLQTELLHEYGYDRVAHALPALQVLLPLPSARLLGGIPPRPLTVMCSPPHPRALSPPPHHHTTTRTPAHPHTHTHTHTRPRGRNSACSSATRAARGGGRCARRCSSWSTRCPSTRSAPSPPTWPTSTRGTRRSRCGCCSSCRAPAGRRATRRYVPCPGSSSRRRRRRPAPGAATRALLLLLLLLLLLAAAVAVAVVVAAQAT